VLIELELLRATRRSEPQGVARTARVLDVGTLSPTVIARAAGSMDGELQLLDAIHLATAEHISVSWYSTWGGTSANTMRELRPSSSRWRSVWVSIFSLMPWMRSRMAAKR